MNLDPSEELRWRKEAEDIGRRGFPAAPLDRAREWSRRFLALLDERHDLLALLTDERWLSLESPIAVAMESVDERDPALRGDALLDHRYRLWRARADAALDVVRDANRRRLREVISRYTDEDEPS